MTTIAQGQTAVVGVGGLNGTAVYPLGSLTATIDNDVAAYLCKIQPDNAAQAYYQVCPGTVATGAEVTVNVTLNGTSQGGNVLPPVTTPYVIQGPPLPPQATQISVSPSPNVGTQFPAGTNPNSPVITLI